MGESTIRVASLDKFKEFIDDLGTTPEGLTGKYLLSPTLTTGADQYFKELEYLNKTVDYQSKQLTLFVEDVISGYAGAVEIVNFVGSNYFNAEMYSGQKLREPMSQAEADAANKTEINEGDDGKPYDAHGWRIDGPSVNEVNDLDFYHEQKELKLSDPPRPKPTDWADPGRGWEKGDAGEAFRHVHWVFMQMKPERLTERSVHWTDVAKALESAASGLRRSTKQLTDAWISPAASSFDGRMQQTIVSVSTWADSARKRADVLKTTAEVMVKNMGTIDSLKLNFDHWAQSYEETESRVAKGWLDYYDVMGILLGNHLSDALILVAGGWGGPPRYPGFLSETPLPAPTAGPTPTGGPGGPGGGRPPGATGGPPGGTPKPGGPNNNAQKIIDGMRDKYEEAMKKQRKEYEKALKAQQEAAAKLKKQYEEALAKQREAANKQAEGLQKALQEAQQQGVPPGLDATPPGVDDALRQQQDLLDSLGATPPQSIEDLTRDLGRTMEKLGLDPTPLAALPSYLAGLNGPGAPGGPVAGLPGASNSPDLLGRSGTAATTTGLGTSALTGRVTPGVMPGATPGMGMGGMPMMPPMGGMPMGGGGAAPLSGRKNRPPLPGEEAQKPVTRRPRIVDPAGDGTTESRPARAGDRRAAVAQPVKAPEAEPGQALGRTA